MLKALLARLTGPKAEEPDAFMLRLARIQRREMRIRARRALFRVYGRHLAA